MSISEECVKWSLGRVRVDEIGKGSGEWRCFSGSSTSSLTFYYEYCVGVAFSIIYHVYVCTWQGQ